MSNLYYNTAEEKMMIVESLLKENEDKELQRIMDREFQKLKPIPLDMFAAQVAISNIIQAEVSRGNVNYNRSVTGLMSLDLQNVTTRNKFRLDNYYKRFYKSRHRGFDFEGLVAGFLDAEISENKNSAYDIVPPNGELISCKTVRNTSESIVLKSVKTQMKQYYDMYNGPEEYKKHLEAILSSTNPISELVDSEIPDYIDIAEEIVDHALSEVDSMLLGVPMQDNKIKMYYFNKEKLIELALTPDMIKEPKSKGSIQIRYSSKILSNPTISGEIVFPNLTNQEYKEFFLGDESTKKVEDTLNNFGAKYGVRNLGRQLPQDIIKDLAKSEKFITDMSFIIGKGEDSNN